MKTVSFEFASILVAVFYEPPACLLVDDLSYQVINYSNFNYWFYFKTHLFDIQHSIVYRYFGVILNKA